MIQKYTFDTSQIPAGSIVTADLADAGVTQPKIKIKTAVALSDADATLTATQMIDSGIFTITPTVARTLTTATAVELVAGMSGYQVGTWFDFTIVNTAAFDVTLAAGVGVTLSGKTIVRNAAATWRARFDSSTTVTIYRLTYDLVDDAVVTAKILDANVTRAKQSTPSGSKSVVKEGITIATAAGDTNEYIIAPEAGSLSSIEINPLVALATSDTNYITWTVVNLGQDGTGATAMLAVVDANTTKATGGTALAINTKRALTIHGTSANLVVAQGDKIKITATVTGTLANTVTYPVYILRFSGTT